MKLTIKVTDKSNNSFEIYEAVLIRYLQLKEGNKAVITPKGSRTHGIQVDLKYYDVSIIEIDLT